MVMAVECAAPTTLLHYSREPFVLDLTMTYPQALGPMKPSGLWLSVEGPDDWKSWCEAEDWNREALTHVTEVTLVSSANVLVLDTVWALDAFHQQYRRQLRMTSQLALTRINWPQVAARHQGLIIAPYHWRRRLHPDMLWYYGWDCSCGCIWDLAAVAAVNSRTQEGGR
jgi:hypothetical protein